MTHYMQANAPPTRNSSIQIPSFTPPQSNPSQVLAAPIPTSTHQATPDRPSLDSLTADLAKLTLAMLNREHRNQPPRLRAQRRGSFSNRRNTRTFHHNNSYERNTDSQYWPPFSAGSPQFRGNSHRGRGQSNFRNSRQRTRGQFHNAAPRGMLVMDDPRNQKMLVL